MLNTIKAALNPGRILRTTVTLAVIFLIAEFAGVTSWILTPRAAWNARNQG